MTRVNRLSAAVIGCGAVTQILYLPALIKPDQCLTAAAGRYVGCKRTTCDLVLFLDEDMELREGWLGEAIYIIHSRPDVAVITGQVIDSDPSPLAPSDSHLESLPAKSVGFIDVLHGGGAAMNRRSVLGQVGTFNSYLFV